MIDPKTKQKLIRELEKSGNVYLACLKLGVDRSTYYRWRNESKKFKSLSDKAMRTGRENNCDIAEHALMLNVKDKKMDAIKYVLSHNSTRYKPKIRKVIIEHSQTGQKKEGFEETKREHWDQLSEAWRDLTELVRNPAMELTEEQTEEVLSHLPDIGLNPNNDSD